MLSAGLTLPLIAASRLPPPLAQKAVVAFNLGLPTLSFIWVAAPGGSRPGNAAAARALHAVGLLALVMHLASVVDLVVGAGGPGAAVAALKAVAANGSAAVQPANFMQVRARALLGRSRLRS